MARRRYGRKSRGRRSKSGIPLVQAALIGYPMVTAYNTAGFTKDLPKHVVYQLTGFDPSTGKWDSPTKGIGLAIGLLVASTVGTKIANRVGANRLLKKATGNLIRLI